MLINLCRRSSLQAAAFLSILMFFVGMNAHAQQDVQEYRMGPGDVVNISVFGEDDLSPEIKINERGRVTYPFLGELAVLGLTTTELEAMIVGGLKGPYLIDPKVSVSISTYRLFYINGQVESPGGYSYEPGLTVRKAISLAGGLTERASLKKIFLVAENAISDSKGVKVSLDDRINAGDIITIEESFF